MNDNQAKTHIVALGLGSNVGDRMAAMRAAVEGLQPYMNVTAKSHVYETAPLYVTDQPAFLNAAVIGETKLPVLALLGTVKDLENELGRQPTFHYGPRAIDIDILFYGQEILNMPELSVPHPRMVEREFVLRPLNDIAPDWRNPSNGQTVSGMLSQMREQSPRSSEKL